MGEHEPDYAPAIGRAASLDPVTPPDSVQRKFALLIGEHNHRIRNLLVMVEAAIEQTQSASVEEYRTSLLSRIIGLRGLQEIMDTAHAETVSFAELVHKTLRPHSAQEGRILAEGPGIEIGPRLALALHIVLHELATNATKYGALSSTRGIITIRWELRDEGNGPRKLAVFWKEQGGPEVKQPNRRGFGSRVIARALDGFGQVKLEFKPEGAVCMMLIDIDENRPFRP